MALLLKRLQLCGAGRFRLVNPIGRRFLASDSTELETKRKRCLYQSKERGMLENDLLLGSFAAKNLGLLPEHLLDQYDRLLQEVDPDIFAWITGAQDVPEKHNNEIMRLLQQHSRANPLNYRPKYK